MDHNCKHFMDSWDQFREGLLKEPELTIIEQHLCDCSKCRNCYEVVECIGKAVRETEMDPFVKRRMAVAAANFRRPSVVPVFSKYKSLRTVVLSAAVSAMLLTGLSFLVLQFRNSSEQSNVALQTANEVYFSGYSMYFYPDGRREIEIFPGTSLFLFPDSVITTLEMSSDAARFELNRGRVVAEIGAQESNFRFVIVSPNSETEARGTVFSVNLLPDGAEETMVSEGSVEIRNKAEQTVLVFPGEAYTLKENIFSKREISSEQLAVELCLADICDVSTKEEGSDTTKTTHIKSQSLSHQLAAVKMEEAVKQGRFGEASSIVNSMVAEKPKAAATVQLLAGLARAYRSAKMFNEAKNVYMRIIENYPNTSTAADSLVALGQIEYRTMGLPNEALHHFEQYLSKSPNGLLAETARAERIRVLQSRGRINETIAACDEYISLHKNGFGLSEVLRRRADALVKTGKCKEAITDYNRVVANWPGTMEAKRAKDGITSCH